jgi:hypothetical protein
MNQPPILILYAFRLKPYPDLRLHTSSNDWSFAEYNIVLVVARVVLDVDVILVDHGDGRTLWAKLLVVELNIDNGDGS